MTVPRTLRRASAASASAALLLTGLSQPASALQQIQLKLPLLQTSITIQLKELTSTSELDRATNGAIGRKLVDLFNAPLPLQTKAVVNQAAGSAMLSQALMLLSSLGGVDGLPGSLSDEKISRALDTAAAKGPLTMLTVLQSLPGQTASVDLNRALFAVQRLAKQQEPADTLLAAVPPVSVDPTLNQPGPLTVQRRETQIPVSYRSEALRLVVISPTQGANGRLVLISHGLWDSPASFEGWGRHLASHGYTVLLPYHPGSDQSQQQAMLSGKVPPPGPAELRLRPLDISALIDAAAAGKLGLPPGLRTDSAVVLGQSWGATTVLQLAGVRPSSTLLQKRCQDINDPSRNLSWVLQCSFVASADKAALADPRVKAVVAVSPPTSLLFDAGAAQGVTARVLMVSGSRDWVVPSNPEAIMPMAMEARRVGGGHRLVLAKGGDHFNLGAHYEDGGGPLGALMLAWVNGAFAAGAAAAPAPGAPSLLPPNGWGNATFPLADVSGQLPALAR
jgi:predicted dienelactone hydrolase